MRIILDTSIVSKCLYICFFFHVYICFLFVVDPFKLCGIKLGVDHVYSHIIAEEK